MVSFLASMLSRIAVSGVRFVAMIVNYYEKNHFERRLQHALYWENKSTSVNIIY